MWRKADIRVHAIARMCEAVGMHGVIDETVLLYKERFGYKLLYLNDHNMQVEKTMMFPDSAEKQNPCFIQAQLNFAAKRLMPYQVSWDIIVSNQNSQKLEFAICWLSDTQKFFPDLQTSKETSWNLNFRVITPLRSINKHGTNWKIILEASLLTDPDKKFPKLGSRPQATLMEERSQAWKWGCEPKSLGTADVDRWMVTSRGSPWNILFPLSCLGNSNSSKFYSWQA